MTPGVERRWLDTAERWYRILIAVSFPRAFRKSFGATAAATFRDRARETLRTSGRIAVVRACLAATPRVLWEGMSERFASALNEHRRDDRRHAGGVDMMMSDLRHSWRGLRSSPRFTLVVVLTFALAVGVNTTVFSFVRGILLRPLPIADAERVVLLGQRGEEGAAPSGVTSPPAVRAIREGAATLTGVAAFAWEDGVLSDGGEPVRVTGAQVEPGYLATLGQPPALGREFAPEESGPAAEAVILISHAMWQTRFAGERTVLGRTVDLDGTAREIIGVLPAGLVGPHDLAFGAAADFMVPMWWNAEEHNFGVRVLRAVGRLAADASLVAANSELAALSMRVTEANPGYGTQRLGALAIREYYVADGRSHLLLLQLAVGLVLLIGAVNVMNLALARGVERRQGMAIRAALGAGRAALVRSVLLEVLLAAVLGGALGALLAVGLVRGLILLAPAGLPQLEWVRVDALTLAGAAAFTLAAGLLAGLVPALRLLGSSAVGVLTREGLRSTAGPVHRRLQSALAAAQIALAVALLVGAGLLLRSFVSLMSVDLGYDPEGVHVLQLDLPATRHATPGARVRFARELKEALEAHGEIVSVTVGSTAPQHGLNNFSSNVGVLGWVEGEERENPWAFIRAVEPGYLAVLGLDVEAGRDLQSTDRIIAESSQDLRMSAALVNAEFARRFLPGNPLGARLVFWGDTMEVVGVAEAMRYGYPGADLEPEVYLPNDGRLNSMMLIVRGRGDGTAAAVRGVVRAADPTIPVDRLPSMIELLSAQVAVPRLAMVLVTLMAAVALSIAGLGVYGVLGFIVAHRSREIGVRMALGAAAVDVLGMLMRQGLRLAAWGMLVGLSLAWAGSRLLAGRLYQVGPRDPAVFVGVALVIGIVALSASWLPAVRAARLDPVRTLREG
jgi:putative ABC transport system permease protein